MKRIMNKQARHCRRKRSIRSRVMGHTSRPRVSVYRSARNISAQVIDDLVGNTIAAASTTEKELRSTPGGNCLAAAQVGELLARRALEAGVTDVVFDRSGYLFHGRVKALADSAREVGLKF